MLCSMTWTAEKAGCRPTHHHALIFASPSNTCAFRVTCEGTQRVLPWRTIATSVCVLIRFRFDGPTAAFILPFTACRSDPLSFAGDGWSHCCLRMDTVYNKLRSRTNQAACIHNRATFLFSRLPVSVSSITSSVSGRISLPSSDLAATTPPSGPAVDRK
jgi:hypothetical protein